MKLNPSYDDSPSYMNPDIDESDPAIVGAGRFSNVQSAPCAEVAISVVAISVFIILCSFILDPVVS